jgi:hypothetical protein
MLTYPEGVDTIILETFKRLDVQVTLGRLRKTIYLVNTPRFQLLLKLKLRVVLYAN